MKINTTEILTELKINNDVSQKIEIKNVEISSLKKIITIIIESNFLITSDYYEEIMKKSKEYFNCDIQINFILDHPYFIDQEITKINNYIDFFIRMSTDHNKTLKTIKHSIEKNTLIFHVSSSFEEMLIGNEINKINIFLTMIGLTKFKIEIEKNIIEMPDIEEEPLEIISVEKKVTNNLIIGANNEKTKSYPIVDVIDDHNMITNPTIIGKIFNLELRDLKNSALLTIMVIDDSDSTIICKTFTGFNGQVPTKKQLSRIKVGQNVKISGRKTYDKFIDDDVIEIKNLMVIADESVCKVDEAVNKRIEMHLHTKMSKNNGISSMEDYIKRAKDYGHAAISITDHGTLQGFVEAEKYSKIHDLKVIYGIEANLVNDPIIVHHSTNQKIDETTFVVFDLETTGLSANFNKLIEIGAVKITNGIVVDRFQKFVKIDEPVSDFTTQLTGITDDDLNQGLDIKDALREFYQYSKNTVLVAHNAIFDLSFLFRNYEKHLGLTETQPVLDTLELARMLHPENTYYTLKILAKKYQVALDSKNHHRADYDAEKLMEIFLQMLSTLKEKEITTLSKIDQVNDENKTYAKHALIYVKNQSGLRDMYELVSDANTVDFHREPRIKKTKLEKLRNNLIVTSSGCVNSEVINSYLNDNIHNFKKVLSFYDYIEILPISQYSELIVSGTFINRDQIKTMINDIVSITKEMGIKVFASGNVHYLNKSQYIAKEILLAKDYKPNKLKKNSEGIEELIDKIRFQKLALEKREKISDQYFKSTLEMLNEFNFIENAEEVVINIPQEINESIDNLKIIPDDLFNPEIEGVDDKLLEIVYDNANRIYGKNLPELVKKRIDKEANSIISYGFSVVYYISYKLVKYSLDNGYLVGSRGSVGSSLIAFLMNITEVNPLVPHYVCPKCHDFIIYEEQEYSSGYDLPPKICSNCNSEYISDGQDIPFETFLGFKGDKVPDIDLNFSGEFQARAHDFVRSKKELDDDELFDFDHAFRAGTIGTIAEKTAYAYVRNYLELQDKSPRRSDIQLHISDCVGIKRTTGQHPGGIIVIPQHREIYEFTAVQFPADDTKQTWRTTHFDFHAIHDNLLKLDILGHDDPTMLRRLYDLTGVDPQKINVNDSKIMELFVSLKSLNIEEKDFGLSLGTLGVPEFGTFFVMELLKSTKPKTFSELVQISGLSHGTDVWLGNAEKLIEENICTLSEVIGCRDDIMIYLMNEGLDPLDSFIIMEKVRKGKGLDEADIINLKDHKVQDWYIQSCQKIKYLFPKAHAAAYVLMALRIAYYKVYYPLEYYAAYFSSRVDDFDSISMLKGKSAIMQRIELLESSNNEMSDIKKKGLLNSLRMCLEMNLRGFNFIKFDLEKSDSFSFILNEEKTGLIMPFSIIDGLGEKEALNIISEREKSPFLTKEDLKKRTKIKNKTFEFLDFFDVFEGLEDDNQISLF